MLNLAKYKGTRKQPTRPRSVENLLQEVPVWLRGCAEVTKKTDELAAEWHQYDRLLKEYIKEQTELSTLFELDALACVGLTGHPRAGKAMAWAYERADRSGQDAVFIALQDAADLLIG